LVAAQGQALSPEVVSEPSCGGPGRPRHEDEFGHRRLVTVVVRLVLNRRGELAYGDVVDAANRLKGRFASWEELTVTLRRWLKTLAETERGAPHDDDES
jgi:hypothetical protein